MTDNNFKIKNGFFLSKQAIASLVGVFQKCFLEAMNENEDSNLLEAFSKLQFEFDDKADLIIINPPKLEISSKNFEK